jgi:hypothetical protein
VLGQRFHDLYAGLSLTANERQEFHACFAACRIVLGLGSMVLAACASTFQQACTIACARESGMIVHPTDTTNAFWLALLRASCLADCLTDGEISVLLFREVLPPSRAPTPFPYV